MAKNLTKMARRYSCSGFSIDDAKQWWFRKGAGHAARVREAKGATWTQRGSYVTMERPKHKFDTLHEERRTTIMCDQGRLVAYEGHYRKGM